MIAGQHDCVLKNREAYRRLRALIDEIVEALSDNKMPDHTREELEATLESAYADVKKLIGERVGMTLGLAPEDAKSNAAVEAHLKSGGSLEDIKQGLKAMTKELKRLQQEQTPKEATGQSTLSPEGMRRLRESLGQSAHHKNGRLYL